MFTGHKIYDVEKIMDRRKGRCITTRQHSVPFVMTLYHSSTQRFATGLKGEIKQLDALVNNAGIAFKANDPTPHVEQAEPTLAINYHGSTCITEVCISIAGF